MNQLFKRADSIDGACGLCLRGFADHDHERVDCDMIVQAFERGRAQVHETGRRGRSLPVQLCVLRYCPRLLTGCPRLLTATCCRSTPSHFRPSHSALWAVRLRLLRLLRFFISSAYLDCRLRLLWFRSACSRSLWGLVLGLALVLIYDENHMGGVFVFIIMFSFMIRVAPP